MKPGITLAMIVRNEARCLARCLESVRGVDEIAIVDTGSTDDTVKIAERLGARVRYFEWPGATDVARNESLEMVETEWTLWLDGDEWLEKGAASALRRAIENEDAFGFLLIRRDLLSDGRTAEQVLLRLWRTRPELRLVGVIHEHFTDEALAGAFPGKKLFHSDIGLFHDGYRDEVARSKLERNVELLKRELELRPGQLYYEIELGNTLCRLGDDSGREMLGGIAERIVAMQDQDEAPDVMVDLFLATFLGELPEGDLRSARTDVLLRVARGWFPNSPTTITTVAQVEIRRGNLPTAFRDLLEVERMAETGKYGRANTVHPEVLQEGLFTNLALVAHQLGKFDVAKRNYERLLRLDPANPLALENMRLLPTA